MESLNAFWKCVHIYKHSFEKAPEGAQSRRPETYASTGSSRRCEHIYLPRLPLCKLLAGAVASQGLHPLRRAQRPWQRKRWIQHPWYHERSRGVILKGREIKGFLDSGMAGIYEVKREPGHMVRHLSTAALDLAMLRAQSQHHRFGPDEKCLTS